MSQGVANSVTLYDKDGNPVVLELVNGKLSVVTSDDKTHQKLDEIKLLLAGLIDVLTRK